MGAPMMRCQDDRDSRRPRSIATGLILGLFGLAPDRGSEGAEDGRLALRLRARVEAPDSVGTYRQVETSAEWDPKATAIIVCDMWDLHHSRNATLRLEEMAPRMDRMLRVARARGVLIIHA